VSWPVHELSDVRNPIQDHCSELGDPGGCDESLIPKAWPFTKSTSMVPFWCCITIWLHAMYGALNPSWGHRKRPDCSWEQVRPPSITRIAVSAFCMSHKISTYKIEFDTTAVYEDVATEIAMACDAGAGMAMPCRYEELGAAPGLSRAPAEGGIRPLRCSLLA